MRIIGRQHQIASNRTVCGIWKHTMKRCIKPALQVDFPSLSSFLFFSPLCQSMFVREYLTLAWLAERLLSFFVHLFNCNKTIGFWTRLSLLLAAPPPIPCRTTSPKAWPLRLQASAKFCRTHPQHETRHLNGTEHGRSDRRNPPGVCDCASLSNDLHSAERDGLRKRASLKAGNWIGKSDYPRCFVEL